MSTGRPTVGVVGLGLIGGSVAQGWLARGGAVVAWTRSADTRAQADEQGVGIAASVAEVVDTADVVFLATPLPALRATMAEVAEVAGIVGDRVSGEGVAGDRAAPPTITDVGSVKAPIHAVAKRLLSDPSIFVPGHPMAGTEHAGWASADPNLFRGRTWALAVDDPVAVERWLAVADVAVALGSTVVPVAAAEHDRAVALTSHLPHLLAAGLRTMLSAEPTALTATLVGGSFASATRVVGGSGRLLGAEMAWANREATVARIDQLVAELGRQREILMGSAPESIIEAFRGDPSEVACECAGPDLGGGAVTVAATRHDLLALGRRGAVVTGCDPDVGTIDVVEGSVTATARAEGETQP